MAKTLAMELAFMIGSGTLPVELYAQDCSTDICRSVAIPARTDFLTDAKTITARMPDGNVMYTCNIAKASTASPYTPYTDARYVKLHVLVGDLLMYSTWHRLETIANTDRLELWVDVSVESGSGALCSADLFTLHRNAFKRNRAGFSDLGIVSKAAEEICIN